MVRFFATEKFKEITLSGPLQLRYAISNYGRMISFTEKFEDGRIINGSKIEGYRIFRYKTRIDGKLRHKHIFFYKLVAEHFLEKPSEEHTHVIHLDHSRARDHVENLKWTTREEMLAHQRLSPAVIEAKNRLSENNANRDGNKLTTTKVIMLKKQLADPNRKTRIKMLAKQFGISEMQVYRIKSGENWGHIKI